MFGYVTVDKPELRVREFEEYRGFYCGLCKTLGEKYGSAARLAVNYDLTFLSVLYAGLYEPKLKADGERCVIHPCVKSCVIRHKYQSYCADMTVYLAWLKCKDDWNDERRPDRILYAGLLKGAAEKVKKRYGIKCKKISALMKELSEKEKSGEKNIDAVSGIFGEILAEIFAVKKDEWEKLLRRMGFFMGKFIYILDAFEDLEKDTEKKSYNPLADMAGSEDFDGHVREMLTMTAAECSRSYRQLPIIEYAPLLDNILYSGIWNGYDRAVKRRKEKSGKGRKG